MRGRMPTCWFATTCRGFHLLESERGRELVARSHGDRLPIVEIAGDVFVNPSNADLAERLGFGELPSSVWTWPSSAQ